MICHAALVAFACLGLLSEDVRAQCGLQLQAGGDVPGAEGPVYAMTRWDPDGSGPQPELLVIGGEFSQVVGIRAANIAAMDPATGQWSPLGTGCNGTVADLGVLPNGRLVVVGQFTSAGGVAANHVAQWDGSAWSALGTGLSGPASCLALAPRGELLVGGVFGGAGGAPARWAASWDGTAWSGLGIGPAYIPNDMVVLPNGDVVAVSRYGTVELWNGSSWTVIGDTLPPGWGQTRGSVECAAWAFGRLWVAGSFTHMNGIAAASGAVWNGQSWISASLPVPVARYLANRPNGDLLVAGVGFSSPSVWSFNGSQWSSLGLVTWHLGVVEAVVDLPNGGIVAGGFFNMAGSVHARHLVRWNGTNWWPFGSGLNAPVRAIVALPGGEFVLGGDFTSAGGLAVDRVVRWDRRSFQAIGSGLDGSVNAVALLGNGDLVAGGPFSRAGQTPVQGVARFDGQNWVPLGVGAGGSRLVMCVAPVGQSGVVAGGFFASMGGVPAANIALWHGNSWSPLGAGLTGPSGWVYAVAVAANGDVYAAGSFTTAGSSPAANIARWDGSAWHPVGPGLPGGSVYTMAILPNGDVIAGGDFPSSSSAGAFLARWDGSRWSSLGTAIRNRVSRIEVLPNGDLLVASNGFVIGNQQGSGLARWDGMQWSPVHLSFPGVNALATAPDGRVLVGGSYLQLAPPTSYFTSAVSTCPALAAPFGTSCAAPTGPLSLTALGLPWLGGTCRTRATGFTASSLAASLIGFSVPNTTLASLLPIGVPGCVQLASAEALVLQLPQLGTAELSFTVPRSAGFVGLTMFQQFLQLASNAQNQPIALSGSNGLRLVFGAY